MECCDVTQRSESGDLCAMTPAYTCGVVVEASLEILEMVVELRSGTVRRSAHTERTRAPFTAPSRGVDIVGPAGNNNTAVVQCQCSINRREVSVIVLRARAGVLVGLTDDSVP